ncbi:MAG: ABC transporter permease [Akkermansiaceae bacterium]|nr:ABC transporter permease [Verrucomicrobiales bacterium]
MSDIPEPAIATARPRQFLNSRWTNILGRFLALIIVFTFFAVLVENGKFYTPRNLENILRQSCVYATAGLGLTLVIIAAGIDLSAGSLIALSVVAVAWVLNINITGPDGQPISLVTAHPTLAPILAVLAGVAASTLAGLANGAMVVGLRLVPFIVTLGTMGMIRGLAKGIAKERDIYPEEETWINAIMDPTLSSASGGWKVLPTGVWIVICGVIVASFLLRYMRLGRHIFAVGSNEETARLCGVPVNRTKLFVYTACGFFCGVAGLMQFSYIGGIGQPTTAVMYELFVIAAVIIGGASFNGGEGSILGTLIGALTITILYMGGQQMGWPKWVQEMVIGGIIIIAVAVDRLRHRKTT